MLPINAVDESMSYNLKAEVEVLKQQVQRLIQNQQALGLPTSPWVSPQQAANLLCTSRTRVNSEIDKAEYARIQLCQLRSLLGYSLSKKWCPLAD